MSKAPSGGSSAGKRGPDVLVSGFFSERSANSCALFLDDTSLILQGLGAPDGADELFD